FINGDIAPGVKIAGGLVEHVMKELELSCLPKDLPEFIEVDLANLQAGHSLHLSGVKLPAGITAIVPKDEDPTVATIVIPKVMTAEEEAAEAAAAVVSAADVPTTAQRTKEEEAAAAAAAAAAGGEKGAKPAPGAAPAAKEEKKEKK